AERLSAVARESRTTVLFEAPTRVRATLVDLAGACGGQRPVAVARELTKAFEEVWRGAPASPPPPPRPARPPGAHASLGAPRARGRARRRGRGGGGGGPGRPGRGPLGGGRGVRRRRRPGGRTAARLRGGYAVEGESAATRVTHPLHTSFPENSLRLTVPPQKT